MEREAKDLKSKVDRKLADEKDNVPNPQLEAAAQNTETTTVEKSSGATPAVIKRNGIVKLVIEGNGGVSSFEESLRSIRGVHVIMIGSSGRQGVEVAVKTEDEIPLAGVLRLLPAVAEVSDTPSQIVVKLH